MSVVIGIVFTPGSIANAKSSFTNMTKSAGTGGPSDLTGGHGVMFADVDGDSLPDLCITMIFNDPMPELFFHNKSDCIFAEEGKKRGIDDFDGGSHGTVFADLDNDGDYDVFNGTTWDTPEYPSHNNIFRNNGNGHFTEVTWDSGLSLDRRWPTRGVLAFDMDNDGDLDLFSVTNYQGTNDPHGEQNEVYRNEGKLKFTSFNAGDWNTCLAGQGATDTDFDGDGDIDLIAANRTGPVNILQNDGSGRFTLIPLADLGIHHLAHDGITSADVDNDGDLDLLLAGDDYGELYINQGNGTFLHHQSFTDTAGYMGGFSDLDNDGDQDLVFAGDRKMYINDGDGMFSAGSPIPVSGINDPRGIAFADIDNDGDPDFAIGAKRSVNCLVRNDYNQGNWLKVRLNSPQNQNGAFGTKTFVYPSGHIGNVILGMRESRSNNGYLGQNDPVLHFGLGACKTVDIVVKFLDGSTAVHQNISANQTITVDGTDTRLNRTVTQWSPYVEWTIPHSSKADNPFDVNAHVIFSHPSGETRTTGMFYTGNGKWAFRFTGVKTGLWTFQTRSEEAGLDGIDGKVIVNPHPNPRIHGFVTHFANKWGWMGTNEAFVPQLVMYDDLPAFSNNQGKIQKDIQTFLVHHGFNGFHTSVLCRWFDWNHTKYDDIDSDDPNPDLKTFEALEQLITSVHTAGGFIHLWAWGDEQRHMTPVRWGKNGPIDKRLQRYIAARLGPLPGWTMGYGFDLFEWVSEDDLREWHSFMHQQFGWEHLLGGRPGGPRKGTDHSNQAIYDGLDYASYEHHRPTYEVYLAALKHRPSKPAFSEDRFRIRWPSRYPEKDYDEEMTRRGLWHSTMAGGVANIWGNLLNGGSGAGGSAPYPHPEWMKTYAAFFTNRFFKDMVVDNLRTDGFCLKRSTHSLFLFYKEDCTHLKMDFTDLSQPMTAIAVDTKKEYVEINIGTFEMKRYNWRAPYCSDWAIAVQSFPELAE